MMNRSELFASIRPEVIEIVKGTAARDEKLLAICELLDHTFDHYNWTGFYLADPNADRELVIGPYVGETTDHTRIRYGEGICGQAADTLETFVVDDVNNETNYLSCSIHVKSEIVVPVLKNGEFVAELDIDSHTLAAMTDVDKQELEWICGQVAQLF